MNTNYSNEQLAKRNLKRLDISARNVQMKWIMDFCAQALRDIVIGIGGKSDGFMMQSGFAIAVSSEVMAILSVASDLKDMRERMGKIVVAYDRAGKPVTTEDLEVAGAMTAWMVEAINPNLMQTIEGQPVLSMPDRSPTSLSVSRPSLRIALHSNWAIMLLPNPASERTSDSRNSGT